jgi:hypothetical protein
VVNTFHPKNDIVHTEVPSITSCRSHTRARIPLTFVVSGEPRPSLHQRVVCCINHSHLTLRQDNCDKPTLCEGQHLIRLCSLGWRDANVPERI